jgi:hypothetical protein
VVIIVSIIILGKRISVSISISIGIGIGIGIGISIGISGSKYYSPFSNGRSLSS